MYVKQLWPYKGCGCFFEVGLLCLRTGRKRQEQVIDNTVFV